MRLIDADKLPKYTGYALSADEVAMAVQNAPTIDAVEVVRCKDCINWRTDLKTSTVFEGYYCDFVDKTTNGNFYCAYGRSKL